MSTRLDRLFSRTPGQRRGRAVAGLAALIVVPLAVAGLFAGALNSADDRVDTLPALVVNNDEFVTTTLPDGSDQMVLAGRQLVTELTKPATEGSDSTGFAWVISNDADASKALADGSAYAVLTIPSDFSKSVTSLSGSTPTQADLAIRTDDAHSFLAGSVAQSVGGALTGAFGTEITKQYLGRLYTNLGTLGESLVAAADGSAQLATGVTGVAAGLDTLATGTQATADGTAAAADGAATFASGVDSYTTGVDALSSGLGTLSSGAAGLGSLSSGVTQYTEGVQSAASGVSQLGSVAAQIPAAALEPLDPQTKAAVQGVLGGLVQAQGGLDTLASSGDALSRQTSAALSGVQGGIGQSAAGAAQLAAGSESVRAGASGLASGLGELSDGVAQLATGTAAAASGAHQLETGAGDLAAGLATGAESASALTDLDPTETAKVIAAPVTLDSARDNPLDSIGPIIGMLFVPVGLWIGALAIFLVMKPLSAIALASTATTGRLVWRSLGRGFAIAAAQALAVVLLLHSTLGVSWTLAPATFGFSVLLAFVFVTVNHFLTAALGRIGVVISLVLLSLQLVSVGGLYPLELVSEPFRVISPFLPLTWAVQGIQAIVSGGSGADVASAVFALLLFAIVAVLLSTAVVARRRGARSFALAAA
ncbi:YhgE/Pip family protein [Cryobacterium sp. PAMC25264]|uniref:YhgE/Pip family protein n=1 Tax=Cryobacterium sp. PAMC25264 TaxID=2861288 RepID=UPI001C62AE05|nr:YhgE/Pip family protein [Cryobacterium sp. PAMC25264]QYF75244.1 YhgE/Pip family protein [Cryobacterium sp. PAMC25264]